MIHFSYRFTHHPDNNNEHGGDKAASHPLRLFGDQSTNGCCQSLCGEAKLVCVDVHQLRHLCVFAGCVLAYCVRFSFARFVLQHTRQRTQSRSGLHRIWTGGVDAIGGHWKIVCVAGEQLVVTNQNRRLGNLCKSTFSRNVQTHQIKWPRTTAVSVHYYWRCLHSPVGDYSPNGNGTFGYESAIANWCINSSCNLQLGPNVSIGPGASIGPGVRMRESIVLDNAVIKDHTLVLHSISEFDGNHLLKLTSRVKWSVFVLVGRGSTVGCWARVEGTPSDPDPNKPFAKMENPSLFNSEGKLNPSITILGCYVTVPSEKILLNSIVLPHKELTRSYKNEIIL